MEEFPKIFFLDHFSPSFLDQKESFLDMDSILRVKTMLESVKSCQTTLIQMQFYYDVFSIVSCGEFLVTKALGIISLSCSGAVARSR